MSTKRRLLAVRVSADARDAIERFCAENGISMTALFDAIGEGLAHLGGSPPEGGLADGLAATVRRARTIDAERRSRPSKGDDETH